jgi:hypothetical protein
MQAHFCLSKWGLVDNIMVGAQTQMKVWQWLMELLVVWGWHWRDIAQ